jgi:hypothetical protein
MRKPLIQIPFFCVFAPEDWIASSQELLAMTVVRFLANLSTSLRAERSNPGATEKAPVSSVQS